MRRLLAILMLLLLATPLRAQPVDVSDVLSIEVLPGWRTAEGRHLAGLRVRLQPGWKTYWRSAGAAGIAPRMDWRGSRGARSVTPLWPRPTLFGPAEARSIGYTSDFVLPLEIVAATSGPVELSGVLDLGVCADICLPARVTVRAELPAAGRHDPAIANALANRPRRVDAPARCTLRQGTGGLVLAGEIDVAPQGQTEAVVFELPDPAVWITDADVTRRGARLQARAEVIASDRAGLSVDRSRLRITVIGERGAVEILGCTG
ncbi:protein-disulfide reductase DsbD domain-containing protein [uncultured Jannaschia sp.]|uniref:protein-disulfide reductase DsbD domain-containing protein n=1 Tax=uncultured Jannaschia sp. TaxID=293347 RepID=UPI0026202F84|nr:protein-disulfide reductase DsbD domain-containing protein [uncultured Jannaschia sp.]